MHIASKCIQGEKSESPEKRGDVQCQKIALSIRLGGQCGHRCSWDTHTVGLLATMFLSPLFSQSEPDKHKSYTHSAIWNNHTASVFTVNTLTWGWINLKTWQMPQTLHWLHWVEHIYSLYQKPSVFCCFIWWIYCMDLSKRSCWWIALSISPLSSISNIYP